MSQTIIVKCPKCLKDVDYYSSPHRPFCSERCKIIDLGDWAQGKYAVPTEEIPSEDSMNDASSESPFKKSSPSEE